MLGFLTREFHEKGRHDFQVDFVSLWLFGNGGKKEGKVPKLSPKTQRKMQKKLPRFTANEPFKSSFNSPFVSSHSVGFFVYLIPVLLVSTSIPVILASFKSWVNVKEIRKLLHKMKVKVIKKFERVRKQLLIVQYLSSQVCILIYNYVFNVYMTSFSLYDFFLFIIRCIQDSYQHQEEEKEKGELSYAARRAEDSPKGALSSLICPTFGSVFVE